MYCILQLEKRNVSASQTLRSALFKTESTHPGFAYNLIAGIMKQGHISINMNESILRLQGTVSDQEGKIWSIKKFKFLRHYEVLNTYVHV